MKTLALALCALNALNIAPSIEMCSPSAPSRQPASERPKFHVEIHPTGEKGPTYTITNLSGKPLWAMVLELSSSSQPARKSKKNWDALLESHPPIEPGASLLQHLSTFGGNPLPDKIEVIAVVWTDGQTFGPPASVNSILNNRISRAPQYEDAAAILQQGLNQNWTRDQYQQAFRDKPDNGAVYTVRTALSATQQTAQTPQEFTHTMQFLLKSFQQLSTQLRKVKPI
jgi:hypothetical protein